MPIKHKLNAILVCGLVVAVLGSAIGAFAQGMPDRITLQAEDFFPSALAYDPARDRFLVASAQGGGIQAVGADGALTPVVTDDRLISVRSLTVDPATDTLIVVNSSVAGLGGGQGFAFGGGRGLDGTPPADLGTPGALPAFPTPDGTMQPGQRPDGAPAFNAENFDASTSVHVYSLATGEALRTVDLTDVAPEGAHLGGAAALDAAGNLFVADSLGGLIYMIDAAGGTYYLENAAFTGGGFGMGPSAIVYDSASNSLLVTQSGTGGLWRVSLSDPANPVQVTLPAEVTAVRNVLADGTGSLLVSTGGRDQTLSLVKLSSGDGWTSASVTGQVALSEFGQNAVMRGSDVYLLTGGFASFGQGDGAAATPDPNAASLQAATPGPIEIVRVASGL